MADLSDGWVELLEYGGHMWIKRDLITSWDKGTGKQNSHCLSELFNVGLINLMSEWGC